MSGSWEWGCDARYLEKYHRLKDGFSERKELYPSANGGIQSSALGATGCPGAKYSERLSDGPHPR